MVKTRSLVLVTVDCLRADHVGFLGYDRPTTPFLDSLTKNSLVFRNAIVAGTTTYHSFPAIMASRYPLALGRDLMGLAPDEPTLASALNQLGYATAAFVAANPYISRQFGYSSGFETFHDFMDSQLTDVSNRNGGSPNRLNRVLAKASGQVGLGKLYEELYFHYGQWSMRNAPCSFDQLRRFPAASVIVDHACHWLSKISGPFFLWLHFMDPHAPYYPLKSGLEALGHSDMEATHARRLNSYWNREDLTSRRLRSYREEIISLYDAGIRSVDAQLVRLVEKLQELNLWESSVFALTADHGEEFLEHGGRGHFPPNVTEELVHVPLLIRVPENGNTQTHSAPFSLLDLAPTLLQAVGSPVPSPFCGHSQWAKIKNGEGSEGPVIAESCHDNPWVANEHLSERILAVREARYKLIFDFRSSREQLFDLEADPEELKPLPANAAKPIRRRLLQHAREHVVKSLQLRDPDLRLQLSLHNALREKIDPGNSFAAKG
jgi:arylsulfatase A-like enzyme